MQHQASGAVKFRPLPRGLHTFLTQHFFAPHTALTTAGRCEGRKNAAELITDGILLIRESRKNFFPRFLAKTRTGIARPSSKRYRGTIGLALAPCQLETTM